MHYLAADGSFKDINTNLQANESGAYRMDEGLYQVQFGQRGSDEVFLPAPPARAAKVTRPGQSASAAHAIELENSQPGIF